MKPYVHFRAGGRVFPGILSVLAAAERGGRDGSEPLYGGRPIGDRVGYERIGTLVRKGGVVAIEGLEPAEGPAEGGA